MKGKQKCRILKQIRKEIAQCNNIEFVTSECKFQGECTGTCPKCEQELQYLEQQLQKRQSAGKKLAVAGIAAALLVSTAGCADSTPEVFPVPHGGNSTQSIPSELDGAVSYLPEEEATNGLLEIEPTQPAELMGEPVPPPDSFELMGDLALLPTQSTDSPAQ